MTYKEYKKLVKGDLKRFRGTVDNKGLLKELIFGECYKIIFWYRTVAFFRGKKYCKFQYFLSVRLWRYYRYKYNISLPLECHIGAGLFIPHMGNIVINEEVELGENINISQGVTIGVSRRGEIGVPKVGDNVFFGPGSVVFGDINIGNDVAIGANSIVNFDVPSGSVVIGNPGRIVSDNGSVGYINNKVDSLES